MSELFRCLLCCIATLALFDVVTCLQTYDFTVDRSLITADCVPKLQVVINGVYPGPPIRVSPGEEIIVNVYNALPTEAIAIHWHGQFQQGTPFMDGISKISQCPIAPFSSFTYKFRVNDLPGTYFYHVHSGSLSESGAYGSFAIEDPNQDSYVDDYSLMIADHYHTDTNALQFGLLAQPFRWVGDPNNILVNGKGVFNCTHNDAYTCSGDDGTDCVDPNDASVCGANDRHYTVRSSSFQSCLENTCSFEEFEVNQGETYLFRMINPSPLSHFSIIFQSHTMTVVGIDAKPVQPTVVDSVDLKSGQRVDILVTMDQEADSLHWISVAIRGRPNLRNGAAILRYSANTDDTSSLTPFERDMVTIALEHPAWDDYDYSRDIQDSFLGYSDPPQDVTNRWILLSTQERFDLENNELFNGNEAIYDPDDLQSIIGEGDYRPENNCDGSSNKNLRWAFNRRTFRFPDSPLLLTAAFNPDRFEEYLEEEDVLNKLFFKVEENKVYDIVLQNYPTCGGVCETHPIHLHGHAFWVLGHFFGEWEGSQEQIDALCTENCPLRDSAWLFPDSTRPFAGDRRGGCGYTYIRFKATSPGVWPIHCHQVWHFLMGKIAIIFYDSDEIIENLPDIDDIDVCGNDVSVTDVYETYESIENGNENEPGVLNCELSDEFGVDIEECESDPCDCDEAGLNCMVCNDGTGCSQCQSGYFKLDFNYKCENCQDVFGQECLHCTDFLGCNQCGQGYSREYNTDCELWYCKPE